MIKVSFWICVSCLVAWIIFVSVIFAIDSTLLLLLSEVWVFISAITAGIGIGSFALSYLGGHIIKRNKGAIRLGVLISVLWVIGSFVVLEPPYSYCWTDFLAIGIIPVVSYLGILWVIMGFLPNRNKIEKS